LQSKSFRGPLGIFLLCKSIWDLNGQVATT